MISKPLALHRCAGLPLLIQRTIARQIQLEVIIVKGRYGEVSYWAGVFCTFVARLTYIFRGATCPEIPEKNHLS